MLLTPSPNTLPDKEKQEMILKVQRAWEVAKRSSFISCMEYLKHVVINSDPPRPFREVAEPWQWALASKLIPAVEYAAQVRKQYDGPQKFWITLPKGHDKTTLIGRLLNWAMAFAHTHLTGYACAKDREQAGLLVDSMMIEANLNPWLKETLSFKNWKVLGRNDSKLHVVATDAAGFSGTRGDLVIVDEISQWTDEEFFRQVLFSIDKRPRGVLIIITNAGQKDSWQWNLLQDFKKIQMEFGWSKQSWWCYEAPHRLAGWMDEEKIEQVRRVVPESMAKMLFDNVWVDPNEENPYITRTQAASCEAYIPSDLQGDCFLAIDYGPVKDRTAMVVVRRVAESIYVERLDVLQGSKEKHVPISVVEEWIDRMCRLYPVQLLVIDKYQMEATIQKYRGSVPIEVFEPRGSSGNYALAENLRHLIVNGQIKWSSHCGTLEVKDRNGRVTIETFTDEICGVAVKITPGGYRIYNPPGKHDDRTCAVGMASLYAMRVESKRSILVNDFWF